MPKRLKNSFKYFMIWTNNYIESKDTEIKKKEKARILVIDDEPVDLILIYDRISGG